MAKTSGGVRHISTVDRNGFAQNAADYRAELATGKYDINISFLSDTGAYVLFEKGHRYHIEEIEAARAMADNGIIVKLSKEGDPSRATKINSDGTPKFSEGTLSIENLTYEQSTKTELKSKAEMSVKRALEHAKTKGADVAVIYDKAGVFHRNDIQAGIAKYESFPNNNHRFKAILVIDQHKNVYEWTHDN